MEKIHRTKGSVTLYLLLSLTCIMGIIFTMAESIRIQCINAKLRSITFMAADSCYSEYVREVFDEYGIMGLWKSTAEFTAAFEQYMRDNLSTKDLELYQDADLYRMSFSASAVSEIKHLTDDNGSYFESQVKEYMQYRLVQEVLTAFLEQFEIFRSGGAAAAFIEKINSYQDVFLKVSSAVNKIQTAADKTKSVIYNPKTILGNMEKNIEGYEATNEPAYIAQFNIDYWDLTEGKGTLDQLMEQMENGTKEYYESAELAESAIGDLRNTLDVEEDLYAADTLEALQQQIDELELKTADKEADYYKVASNYYQVQNFKKELEGVDYVIDDLWAAQAYGEIEQYKELVKWYKENMNNPDSSQMGLRNADTSVQKENSGFLNTIKTLFSKGLLSAVTSGDISNKKVDLGNVPSKTISFKNDQINWGLLSASMERLIMGEYVLEHFGSYTEPLEDNALDYEVEYIIGGRQSDNENLKEVANKLVLLRSGVNLISFLMDADKLAQAELTALGIIGFTGMEPLVEILKLLIICSWCLAESICDVKALLEGNKVAIIKTPDEWTLSINGLKNFSKTILPAANNSSGASYEDHIRILLLAMSPEELSFRCMDMIQLNMCKKYNKDFLIKECIVKSKTEASFEAGQLFVAFPFVSQLIGQKSGSYSFSYTQKYAY